MTLRDAGEVDLQPVTVVVVDAQQVYRIALVRGLGREDGIDVVGEAGTGTTGLALIEQCHADCALVADYLPDFNGVQGFIRSARALDGKTRVIVLAAVPRLITAELSIEHGAAGHLSKSVRRSRIAALIRYAAAGATWVIDPADIDG